MNNTALISVFFLLAIPARVFAGNDLPNNIFEQVQIINKVDKASRGNPTPDQTKQRNDAVQKIVDIGSRGKSDAGTEIAVSRALTSVQESQRAIPFSDAAVALARAGRDPKTLVAALSVSADAYGKSGLYAQAEARAEEALDLAPGDAAAGPARRPPAATADAPGSPLGSPLSLQVRGYILGSCPPAGRS